MYMHQRTSFDSFYTIHNPYIKRNEIEKKKQNSVNSRKQRELNYDKICSFNSCHPLLNSNETKAMQIAKPRSVGIAGISYIFCQKVVIS